MPAARQRPGRREQGSRAYRAVPFSASSSRLGYPSPSAGSSDDLPNPLTRSHARARLFAKPRFIESGREPETLHKKAAIDAELGAGDVVAVLRAEIHAGPRHFLRLREPLHWDLVQEAVPHLLWDARHHLGLRESRGDCVHGDSL